MRRVFPLFVGYLAAWLAELWLENRLLRLAVVTTLAAAVLGAIATCS